MIDNISIKRFFKIHLMFFLVLLAFTLIGCPVEDDTVYPEYLETVNTELNCVELSYNGITYSPYGVLTGVFNSNFKGNQIGIRENDPLSKIYEIKGYNSNEWIVEYDDTFMSGNPLIYKATTVNVIPKELEKYKQYVF